jgi:hypothetical protein
VLTATLFTATSSIAFPNFDPDVYTYIATGRVAAVHGHDPYAVATDRFPADPYFRYQLRNYTHHPDIKLPAWMPLNVALAKVAGDNPVRGLLTYRSALALALANLFLVLLIVRSAPARGRRRRRRLGMEPDSGAVLSEQGGHADGVLRAARGARADPFAAAGAVVLPTLATFVVAGSTVPVVLVVQQPAAVGGGRSRCRSPRRRGRCSALYAPYSHPRGCSPTICAREAGAGGHRRTPGARS